MSGRHGSESVFGGTMKQLIYIAEDEKNIRETLRSFLENDGYEVCAFETGDALLGVFYKKRADLVILDIMMPGTDGLTCCRRIREKDNVPIILLTAKDEVMDKVAGLDSGADDYLTKPFAIEELLARMRVAFKHSEGSNIAKKTILQVQNLEIDTEKRMVTVDGKVVDLTKKEYELLTYLVQNKNIVLTREQILNEVWGYSYIGETNVVDVYIRYLRAKIDEAFGKKYILTIRGVGYYVKEE